LGLKARAKEPVDIFIAGCMGGGGCHVHNALCQNVETECKAAGGAKCDFLTGTEKELKNRKLWNIAVRRYKLKEILPLQEEIFKNYKEGKTSEILERIVNNL